MKLAGFAPLLTLLSLSSLGSDDLTFESLRHLIENKNLTSVESVLAEMPTDYRSNYALLYQSRSAQGASPENPRVILFGRNSKLTCSFNGEHSQSRNDSFECFQFREATRTFDFRQIQFPTAENGLTQVKFSESNRGTDGKSSCTGCHGGADPRPNWDHYPQWPGAFGSDGDELRTEARPYAAFVANRALHPRYRWLLQGTNTSDPFLEPSEGRVDIRYRPNLRFTEATSRLNALRDLRILEGKVPHWQTLAFAVSALQCTPTTDQAARMQKAGLHFEVDSNLGNIFAKVGMAPNRWSTQTFSDPPTSPEHPWEFQSGFGYLSQQIAMAVVQDLARNGDTVLKNGVARIRDYYRGRPSQPEVEFYNDMNEIVTDVDFFGAGYERNLAEVCPRLTEVFVGEYLTSAILDPR
jgi:hypothetical protein